MSYVVALTYVHTLISFAALFLAVPMILGLLGGHVPAKWADWFLAAAVATTATGFLFPFSVVTPAFVTGLLATALFVPVLLARFVFRYAGVWRRVYAAGMVLSAWLVYVAGVAQLFLKVPFFNALAPTGSETPFLAAQIAVLAVFGILAVLAALRFRGETLATFGEPAV